MTRIVIQDLEGRIGFLNRITGSPETSYTKLDGKFTANIGNYHLIQAYGGCALHRMDNEGGGVQDISRIGYVSKKELYNWINSFIDGIQASRGI